MKRSIVFYIVACAVAALIPYVSTQYQTAAGTAPAVMFPGWPSKFENKTLTPIALNEMETSFASDFPGRIARFSDGERELIIRWVTEPTRKLHPSSDCFQGLGYIVKPLAAHRDEHGALWPDSPRPKATSACSCTNKSMPTRVKHGRTYQRGTGQHYNRKAARGGRLQ